MIGRKLKAYRPRLLLTTLLIALAATSCNSRLPSATSPPRQQAQTVQPSAAVYDSLNLALPALLMAEREASRSGDLATLAQLWAPDSRIVDGRNTPDSSDDYRWEGRQAILDRYTVAVFPQPPPALTELPELAFRQDGDMATAVNGHDRWRLIRVDDRWWLQELSYQIPEVQDKSP